MDPSVVISVRVLAGTAVGEGSSVLDDEKVGAPVEDGKFDSVGPVVSAMVVGVSEVEEPSITGV